MTYGFFIFFCKDKSATVLKKIFLHLADGPNKKFFGRFRNFFFSFSELNFLKKLNIIFWGVLKFETLTSDAPQGTKLLIWSKIFFRAVQNFWKDIIFDKTGIEKYGNLAMSYPNLQTGHLSNQITSQ